MSDIFNFKMTPTTELFYNEDSFYGVYKFSTEDDLPDTDKLPFKSDLKFSTLVGKMQKLTIGIPYSCSATKTKNKKYNQWQYEAVTLQIDKPTNIDESAKFLKCIVTEKQADALLSVYPNIVDMVMNEEEVNIEDVKGIGAKTFAKIQEKIIENYVLSDVITMLKPYGITINAIKSLMTEEKSAILLKQKLKENPYLLTKIRGFGFKRVDAIALQVNPRLRKSDYRLKSFVHYYLSEIGNGDGHSKVKLIDLTNEVKNTIHECVDLYNQLLEQEMDNPTLLYIQDNYVGLYTYYKRECDIYGILKQLDSAEISNQLTETEIKAIYDKFKLEKGYELTEEQKEILPALNRHNVVLLTGRAGSGKSSAIDVVVKAFPNSNISLTALSAKAVRRMVETTGVEDCQTIHRLLSYTGKEFKHNAENPLSSEVLLIDEGSMINSSLFLSLLEAVSSGTKVIIVFDDGQLPPIGVGNVAKDLLSGSFKHINLTKVHRQAQDSGILSDANIIRDGVNPIDKPTARMCRGKLKDMYYLFNSDKQEIFNTAIQYYMKSLNELTVEDVTIIVPRKANAINSTSCYNERIQDLLLGKEFRQVKKGDKIFKLGAKLIQRVNNKDKNVVNGEMGFLTNIYDETFVVDFGDKSIEYEMKEMDELELAYALTVHLMQGSQCHTIIYVCDSNSYVLLSKELTYTALTRASKRCMAIAEPKAFNIGCKKSAGIRNTWLKELCEIN